MATRRYGRYEVKRQLKLAAYFGEEFNDELLTHEALYLNSSSHAEKRYKQRAVENEMLLLIQLFGEPELQKGGTELLKVPNNVLQKLRSAVDKLENITLVVNPEENKVITAFRQYKKIKTTKNF